MVLTMQKLILNILLVLTLLSMHPGWTSSSHAGEKMTVEFLYSIEYAGGRSERFLELADMFFDRSKKELFLLDAATHKIHIFDRNGMYLYTIDQNGKGVMPGSLAVDARGRIFKTYRDGNKIGMMDLKGELLDDFVLPGTTEDARYGVTPKGLCSGPNGEIYVLKSAGGVVRLDPAGRKHEQISISGKGAPNMIFGMTVDPQGRFHFTDMRPYGMVAFDPRNREFKRYGTPGVLAHQITRPVGIAADDAGHIFVTSSVGNKVNAYDRDGNFIHAFGGAGVSLGRFTMPSKIVSDGKDTIYILENALKRVQAFKVNFVDEG